MKEAANESRHCLRKEESHGTMYTLFRRIISGLKLFRKVIDIDYDYATLGRCCFRVIKLFEGLPKFLRG